MYSIQWVDYEDDFSGYREKSITVDRFASAVKFAKKLCRELITCDPIIMAWDNGSRRFVKYSR